MSKELLLLKKKWVRSGLRLGDWILGVQCCVNSLMSLQPGIRVQGEAWWEELHHFVLGPEVGKCMCLLLPWALAVFSLLAMDCFFFTVLPCLGASRLWTETSTNKELKINISFFNLLVVGILSLQDTRSHGWQVAELVNLNIIPFSYQRSAHSST